MKKLILFLLLVPLLSAAHDFKIVDGSVFWEKVFNGIPNTTAMINLVKSDSLITGSINNYTIDYASQGIEFRFLPLLLNDPVNATVKIVADSLGYTVRIFDIIFKITDDSRGLIGQLADIEYYMIKKGKITRDPEMLDVLEIMSKDFDRIFIPLKKDN